MLWATIHRWITFVRMSTIWCDIALVWTTHHLCTQAYKTHYYKQQKGTGFEGRKTKWTNAKEKQTPARVGKKLALSLSLLHPDALGEVKTATNRPTKCHRTITVGWLWSHVYAKQGGYGPVTSLQTLLVSTARACAPPKNCNHPLRRRSHKGCDWSAY